MSVSYTHLDVYKRQIIYEVGEGGEIERMIRFEKEEVATAQSMEEVQKVQKKPQEMSFLELKNFIGEERSRGRKTEKLELILWQNCLLYTSNWSPGRECFAW